MVWIENLVSLWLKIPLSVGAMVLVSLSHGGLGHIEWAKLILLTRSSSLLLVDLHQVIVVVQVFTATELLHHDHLVLSHLGSDFQKLFFLLFLGQINDVCPSLFVFGFEITKEFIESFVFLGHFPYGLVERFTFLSFV